MDDTKIACLGRNAGGIDALNPILEVSWGRKDDNRALPKKCKVTGLGLEDATRIYILCTYLVGGFKYFLFSSLPWEMIQFD